MKTKKTENRMAEAVLKKLRLHCRRTTCGLVRMLENGEIDVFDALAAAPLVLEENKQMTEAAKYELRRLAWLEKYQIANSVGPDDPEAMKSEEKRGKLP